MTYMSVHEFDFRNKIALELLKVYAARPSLDATLVERTFDVADRVTARIKADEATLKAELINKAAMARSARQAEFDELVGCVKAPPLRRAEDKVEVQEISVGQAIEMIASILGEKR